MGLEVGEVGAVDAGVAHRRQHQVALRLPARMGKAVGLVAVGIAVHAQHLGVDAFGLGATLHYQDDGAFA